MICNNENITIWSIGNVYKRFHNNINLNAATLTKPNKVLFCFV